MDDQKHLKSLLAQIISRQVTPESYSWLQEKGAGIEAEKESAAILNAAFALVPRKIGTARIILVEVEKAALQKCNPTLFVQGWTLDRLSRVWLLMHVAGTEKEVYHKKMETLFATAAMNELAALYSALPVLHFGNTWQHRCAEGIRSNIGPVLEAIMCNNTYPAQYLSEGAWNQMVLKAFFTEKPVHTIIGLDARRNKDLALVLRDFAHERWAAGREVPLQLWRCVVPFVDEASFKDIERLARSEKVEEKEAAVLVCRQSTYAPCKDLLKSETLQGVVLKEHVSWQTLAESVETIA